MQVSVQTLEGLKRRLTGRIEAEIVSEHMEKALRDLAKNINLRGFRPGKAPRSMLERRFGQQIRADVSAKLLEQYYPTAIEQGKIEPVSQPEIEKAEIEEDGSMVFEVIVEVAPKVKVQQYKELSAKRPAYKVSDEEVASRLEHVRQQHSTLEPVEDDRGLENGDWAEIDFKGAVNQKPFDGGTAEHYRLEVGAGRLISDLEQGLFGMRKGETKDIPVKFPKDYGNRALAGKSAVFNVFLHSILKRVVPEIDDELAKDAGEGSLDELKEKIRAEVQKAKDGQADVAARESLLDDLLAKNPVDAPARMVERRLDMLQNRLKRNLVIQGLPEDQASSLVESSRESGRGRAERDVKIGFLLEAISAAEELAVSDAELEKKYKEIGQSSDKTVEEIAALFQKEGQVEALREQILEEKALELLLAHATIVPVEPKQDSGRSEEGIAAETDEAPASSEELPED